MKKWMCKQLDKLEFYGDLKYENCHIQYMEFGKWNAI